MYLLHHAFLASIPIRKTLRWSYGDEMIKLSQESPTMKLFTDRQLAPISLPQTADVAGIYHIHVKWSYLQISYEWKLSETNWLEDKFLHANASS